MMKKIFLVFAIFSLCTSCSQFALIASGSSLAISQNAFAKAYSSADMLTIMNTKKDIKKHIYDTIKTNRSTKESD
jgi:hypothetical protein